MATPLPGTGLAPRRHFPCEIPLLRGRPEESGEMRRPRDREGPANAEVTEIGGLTICEFVHVDLVFYK